ncbi:MAG: site-specific integrase [bacterium]|nr:site-specific integrase [bacterium]
MEQRCTMTLRVASARIWIEKWIRNKDGKRSLQNFQRTFQFLGGGERELHTITSEELMTLRLILRKTLAASTVNRIFAALKTVLNHGLKFWGDAVPKVPYFPMEKETGRRDRIVSYKEEFKILSIVSDDRNCSEYDKMYNSLKNKETFRNFFTILMDTGARPSELLRLRPQDYSKQTETLYIGPGKTDESRYVWLPERSVKAFENQAKSCGRGELFKFRIEVVSRYFNFIKKELNIDDPSLTPYCYRHTCATRMIEAGFDIIVVKEQLGHKTLITTQRYAKVDIRLKKEAMKKVDEMRKEYQNEESDQSINEFKSEKRNVILRKKK